MALFPKRHFRAWLWLCCYCKEVEWLIRRICMKLCLPVWLLELGWMSPHLNHCPHTILFSHSKTAVSVHVCMYFIKVFDRSDILCLCLYLQWFFPTLPVLHIRHGTPCLLLLPTTCWLDSEENPCLKNLNCKTRQLNNSSYENSKSTLGHKDRISEKSSHSYFS